MEPYSLALFLRKALARSRSFRTNPEASVEIHTVVCHNDVCYYLAALKSLLRFIDDFRVVVHDDGSLTDEDAQLMRSQIQDLELLNRSIMDRAVESSLAGKTCSLECRRSRPTFMQVTDYFISAKTDRIVSLDSDTLFFAFPQELAEWISSGKELVRYNFELRAGVQFQDRAGNYFFADDEFPFSLLAGVNGGLLCCPRELADFALLESYLAHLQATIGLGSDQQVFAQNVFGLYVRKSNFQYLPFSKEDYKVLCHYTAIGLHKKFRQPAVFKHYNQRTQRFERLYNYQEDLCAVLDELIRFHS